MRSKSGSQLLVQMLIATTMLVALLASCNTDKAKVSANEVVLPASSEFAKKCKFYEVPNPTWKKFDGKLPAEWPAEFSLPTELFLMEKTNVTTIPAQNPEAAATGMKVIPVKGITKGTPLEIYEQFLNQANSAGYSIYSQNHMDEIVTPGLPRHPPSFSFATNPSRSGPVNHFLINVDEYKDMDGWVYFTFQVVLNP